MCRRIAIILAAVLVFSGTAFSEGYDVESFKKSLIEIDTIDVGVYRIELEKIISKAEAEGMDVTIMMKAALEAGVTPASLTSAAIKFYPAPDVVALAILGGGDPAEIINLAIMSGAEPGEIEAGALAASVDAVEAAILVSAAKNLLIDSGEGWSGEGSAGDTGEGEGLALTPGEAVDAGAIAAPAAAGPVGGAGGGFPASPS
ncbi:MAG: hypothetical protein JRF40_02180 [Deltaproteobacteria bacterium]|nr:hypothetical protein [Deltaproteobacteria bacterium]